MGLGVGPPGMQRGSLARACMAVVLGAVLRLRAGCDGDGAKEDGGGGGRLSVGVLPPGGGASRFGRFDRPGGGRDDGRRALRAQLPRFPLDELTSVATGTVDSPTAKRIPSVPPPSYPVTAGTLKDTLVKDTLVKDTLAKDCMYAFDEIRTPRLRSACAEAGLTR
ncbi:hypothetical protein [Streptomyces humi]|uniref:hypothetical protein n=1 Tax=Streptomyces humi TaxID=1428620 RepID=UPI0006288B50|nr:hypothetical protein [Streptomyces humi]